MRIVVTFTPAPCYSCFPYDKSVPLEYESPEAFIVHLEDKLKAYCIVQDAYELEHSSWYRKEPRNKLGKAWTAWWNKQPKLTIEQTTIDIGGYKLFGTCIVNQGVYELPKVQTLEEWFLENESKAKLRIEL